MTHETAIVCLAGWVLAVVFALFNFATYGFLWRAWKREEGYHVMVEQLVAELEACRRHYNPAPPARSEEG